jgi:predicted lipid-binding transport protein (Tim44 family)
MDLIILAIITAFIFYRLSKNLGKIDEEEKQQIHKKLLERKKQIEEILERAQKTANPSSNSEIIVGSKSTEIKDLSNLDKNSQENLEKIFIACNISYDFFMNGAKMAFEMIINGFAKDDLETLKILLAEKIYQGFESAINNRKNLEQKLNTNLISIDKSEIISAVLVDNFASIIVKFYSQQINFITDKDGKIIEGKKDEISKITDIWTFKKDINSNNPNWIVSATSS